MSTYLELKAQLATLDLKIEVALAFEKEQAIREVQAQMVQWNVDPRDLAGHLERKQVKHRRDAA